VGTERGFIGAALTPEFRIFCCRSGHQAVDYNRVNIALLQLAKDEGGIPPSAP